MTEALPAPDSPEVMEILAEANRLSNAIGIELTRILSECGDDVYDKLYDEVFCQMRGLPKSYLLQYAVYHLFISSGIPWYPGMMIDLPGDDSLLLFFRKQLERLRGIRKQFVVKSMPEILSEFSANPDVGNIEYEIDGEVTAIQLRELLKLPYEVALTEHEGHLILTPLTMRESGLRNSAYEMRQWYSRLSLHTHTSQDPVVNTPSFQDIDVCLHCDPRTRRFIVHANGITMFGPIIKYADTGEPCMAGNNVIYRYEKAMGFTLGEDYAAPDQPFIQDIYDFENETRLARKFAEDTGMILDEATWDDEEGIARLMDVINLRGE